MFFVPSVLCPGFHGGGGGWWSDLFGSTCMLFDLLSDHILCFQTIYNFFILIFTFVILLFWFLLLFSTHNTYCISVRPGRGISPLLLFLGFLLLFFLLNVFWVFFFGEGSLFQSRVKSRTEGILCCTDCKASWGKFVICDTGLYCINKINWLTRYTKTLDDHTV